MNGTTTTTDGQLPGWIMQLNNLALGWYSVAKQGAPAYTVTGQQPAAGVTVTSSGIHATADPTMLLLIAGVVVVVVWSLSK